MSSEIAVKASASTPDTTSKTNKSSSKKRKHDQGEDASSSKKQRKQREVAEADEVVTIEKSDKDKKIATENKKKNDKRKEQLAQEVAELDVVEAVDAGGKKKRKKHKVRDVQMEKGYVSENVTINGRAPEASSEEATALAVQPVEELAEPEPEKKERRKKKKKIDTVEEIVDITDDDGEQAGEDDIELPDAPALEDDVTKSIPTIEPQEAAFALEESLGVDLLASPDPTSFHSTTVSMYFSIPAVTLPAHAKDALISMHLSPLLLTYYPPVKGIVLAFENTKMSSKPATAINLPLGQPTEKDLENDSDFQNIRAMTSDQFGAAWVWLTVTFLVFKPQRGDELYGYNNIASDGFVGLVSYNYFQTSISAERIPSDWTYRGMDVHQRKKKPRRVEKMLEDGSRSQSSPIFSSQVADERSRNEIEEDAGYFNSDGSKVGEVMKYRVVDTEMVPGNQRGTWNMQIDGTLLDAAAENEVRGQERLKWERARQKQETPEMTGALLSREGSVASAATAPTRHRVAY